MADRRPGPDNGGDPELDPAHGPIVGAPRWVKVFGIVVGVLVLLLVVLLIVGGGEHGPGRHASAVDVDRAPGAIAPVQTPSRAPRR